MLDIYRYIMKLTITNKDIHKHHVNSSEYEGFKIINVNILAKTSEIMIQKPHFIQSCYGPLVTDFDNIYIGTPESANILVNRVYKIAQYNGERFIGCFEFYFDIYNYETVRYLQNQATGGSGIEYSIEVELLEHIDVYNNSKFMMLDQKLHQLRYPFNLHCSGIIGFKSQNQYTHFSSLQIHEIYLPYIAHGNLRILYSFDNEPFVPLIPHDVLSGNIPLPDLILNRDITHNTEFNIKVEPVNELFNINHLFEDYSVVIELMV